MQKKLTTPPKKPTTNASSESQSKPSELRFKPIQTHQSPHTNPNLAHRPIVIKTHNLHRCQNPHLQRNPPPMPRRNHYQSHQSPHADPSDSTVKEATGSWV